MDFAAEDNMLLLSGVQHFVFCPRQWALVHIDQAWQDNSKTIEGQLLHKNADNDEYRQKAGGRITLHAVHIASKQLGLYGITDAVELIPSADRANTIAHPRYPGRFMHRLRPGRKSLALDIMEELRAFMADRLVLSLINRRQITTRDFTRQDAQSVTLSDNGRKTIITAWQERKKQELVHPYLEEKIPAGLIPHAQAMLMARWVRGDNDNYAPFLLK